MSSPLPAPAPHTRPVFLLIAEVTSPILRWSMPHVRPDEAEVERGRAPAPALTGGGA